MQPTKECDYRWGIDSLKIENGMNTESNIWYKSVYVIDNYGWDKTFLIVKEKLVAMKKEQFIREMLGGLTIEEYMEKYAQS
jgi:hypothetical protein